MTVAETDVAQTLYRQREMERVRKMRLERENQRRLWSEVNYPKALWIWRGRKFWRSPRNG